MRALAPQRGHCICCEKPLVHSELGEETFEKAVARNIRKPECFDGTEEWPVWRSGVWLEQGSLPKQMD